MSYEMITEIVDAQGYFSLADVESTALFHTLGSQFERLELEIGCGRGDFLNSHAPNHSNVCYIGVERHLVSLRRGVEKIKRSGLKNVFLVNADVTNILGSYIAPKTLSSIHLYFPDPWPKKKHQKRRVLNALNAERIHQLLSEEGTFYIRSDNLIIYDDMLSVIKESGLFVERDVPKELLSCKTGFEQKFMQQNKPIYFSGYHTRQLNGSA